MPGLLSEMMEERGDWVSKKKKRQSLQRFMTEVVSGILLVVAVYVIFNYSTVITNLSELLTPDSFNNVNNGSSLHRTAKTLKPGINQHQKQL